MKFEYSSVVWNSRISTESNKLGRVQRKFSTLCYNWLLTDNNVYSYNYILDNLNFHILLRRRYFQALFINKVLKGLLNTHPFQKLLVSEL
jgi:hypothetical protein